MSNSVNLALDVTKTGIQNPLIKVRQGDGGFETLRTTVTANGEPMDLQGWTITFMGTTAGNHKIVDGNVTLVEAPNGIFDYTPSKAWGMDIGDFKIAYFKFVNGDGTASSANFRVSVIEAVDLTQEEAQNYISVVDTTIAEINQHLTDSLANVTQSIANANANANTVSSNVTTLGNRVNDYNNKLAAIQVGGRNYILNSSGLNASADKRPTLKGSYSDGNASISYLDTGIQATNNQGNREWFYGIAKAFTDISATPLVSGNTYTISFKVKGTAKQVAVRIGLKNATTSIESSVVNFTNINNTDWTRVVYTFVIPSGTTGVFIRLQGADANSYFTGFVGGETFTFKELKLELGNVATDWTPAPEDAPSNDAQLVHKTGTETIAGDKTFSGNTTFSGIVTGGQVNLPASGNLNTLTNTGKYYQTTSVNAANWANRPSNAPSLAFSVDVIGQANGSLATQVYYVNTTNRMWVRTMWLDGTTVTTTQWAELANDNNVVHKTGNETIAGDKTFTGITTVNNLINASSIATPYYVEQNPTTFIFKTSGSVQFVRVGNTVTAFYREIPATANGVTLLSDLPVRYRPVGQAIQAKNQQGVITINTSGDILTESTYASGGYFAISYATSSPIA